MQNKWHCEQQFGPRQANLVLIAYASSEGSGEPLHPRSLPEPSLLAHTSSESRGTFRQKARSLAPLNGWACAVKVCHDGMLEDTNSLDGAQFKVYGCTITLFFIEIIIIFNGCEVLIENSVTRVTVRHHEACRMMPISYPSDGIFNQHLTTIMDSFSTPPSTRVWVFY